MKKTSLFSKLGFSGLTMAALMMLFASRAWANHSWGNYHWARMANPFTLKLADNLSSTWDPYLVMTSNDWSLSSILDTTIVPGTNNPRKCGATTGRVEVCNATYGSNGWLGLAQIWASGAHITKAVTKVNDTYFNKSTYNTPAWRNLVMCQEVGHTLGLGHQDENFNNTPLGTCMDYSADPSANQHPNAHDYEQLEIIYTHLDSFTTIDTLVKLNRGAEVDVDNPKEWGKLVKKQGRTAVYERDFGAGVKLFTFIILAD